MAQRMYTKTALGTDRLSGVSGQTTLQGVKVTQTDSEDALLEEFTQFVQQ